jgi:hypothetical protein
MTSAADDKARQARDASIKETVALNKDLSRAGQAHANRDNGQRTEAIHLTARAQEMQSRRARS